MQMACMAIYDLRLYILHKIEDHDDVMCWRIAQLHTHNEHVDDAWLYLHQECIRESTQQRTVVWRVNFVLMTSQWLHQVQVKYNLLGMNNIIVMHSCNG